MHAILPLLPMLFATAVDFQSFTYHPSCADFESDEAKVPIHVTGGKFTGEEGFYFEVQEILRGDLTGDGQDEAVVRTACSTGGTGWFDEGFVYAMKNGKAVLLGRIPGGDRASGSVRCARFEDGALKVERLGNDSGAARGVDFVDTETWRVRNGRLEEAGKSARRRLGGAARPIRFEKGKSSGRVTGKTGGFDEWSLRAREGQTMTVRISSPEKNAAFEIMIDDYTVSCRGTEWSGELPSAGEYRISVLATGGTAEYSLEVAIR